MNYHLKFVLVFFWMLFLVNNTKSQSTNEIEIRTGVIFFDSKLADGDVLESGKGWGSQADITFYKTFDIKRKFKPTVGLGYTNFYYWNVDFFDVSPRVSEFPYSHNTFGGDLTSHYMNLRYGLDIAVIKEKFNLTLMASHYLLLHKEFQGNNQKRIFMNIDLGFNFKLNEKYTLTLSAPFTIHPIVDDDKIRLLSAGSGTWGGLGPEFERFVEMNGIMIGLRYKFNK